MARMENADTKIARPHKVVRNCHSIRFKHCDCIMGLRDSHIFQNPVCHPLQGYSPKEVHDIRGWCAVMHVHVPDDKMGVGSLDSYPILGNQSYVPVLNEVGVSGGSAAHYDSIGIREIGVTIYQDGCVHLKRLCPNGCDAAR